MRLFLLQNYGFGVGKIVFAQRADVATVKDRRVLLCFVVDGDVVQRLLRAARPQAIGSTTESIVSSRTCTSFQQLLFEKDLWGRACVA